MPALNHPTGDIVWEVPVLSYYRPEAVSTHITLAVAVLAILVAIRLLLGRRRTSQGPVSGLRAFQGKHQSTQRPLGTTERKGSHKFGPNSTPGPERPLWADRARSFVPLRVVPGQLGPVSKPATMDHSEGGLGGTYPWPAPAASRGVSTSSPTPPHDPSRAGPSSSTVTGRTRRSRSPRSPSRASFERRISGSSHGSDSPAPNEKGKGPMAESTGGIGDGLRRLELDGDTGSAGAHIDGSRLYSRPLQDASLDFTIPRHFSRPPPPPPLTPPTLDGSVFPFEDRRPSSAASIPPALDMSFIHQPNPEYGGSTSADVLSSSSPRSSATAVSRRRSYARTVPVGIPVPTTTTTASASSSSETMTSGSTTTFSPSSYPPTSPLLPPPPPGQYDDDFLPPSAPPEYEFVGGPGGPGVLLSQQEEEVMIDLQGEIISVVDDAGHGWKRHTRVYGGGVCLACVAAAARDGGHGGHGGFGAGRMGGHGGMGGFYGDKVPLEDRRW